MATFNELKKSFELHVGSEGEMDNAQIAIWFNEAQLDLALDCGKIRKQIYQAIAGKAYDLPTDFLRLIAVEGAEYSMTPDGKISFSSDGEATIYYRAMPIPFSGNDANQTSELHVALHDLIPIFATSRYWDRESEGDYEETGHGTKWMNYYLQSKEQRKKKLDGIFPIADHWTVI